MISFRDSRHSRQIFLLLLIKEKVISKSSVFGLKEECSFRKLTYLEKKNKLKNPDLR